jgi:hypothetical protein
MSHLGKDYKINLLTWGRLFTLFALLVCLFSCNKPANPPTTAAAEAQTFASPDDAGKALLAATKSGNLDTILAIFGPGSKEILDSGDPVQNKETVAAFVAAYETMNRWRKMDDKAEILVVGVDNFPFPIPLRKNGDGRWFFDLSSGKDEILARRIGRDEFAAMDICAALADAQAQYHSRPHDGVKQYAQRFISDDGQQNGLYWKSAEGQPPSPLGPLAAFATAEGYTLQPNLHQPFHGYYFRILTKQGDQAKGGAKDYVANGKMTGGFAFVAYPAEHGNSGVMTFLINQNGSLYQKDLGSATAETAAAMSEFNPDGSWSPAME